MGEVGLDGPNPRSSGLGSTANKSNRQQMERPNDAAPSVLRALFRLRRLSESRSGTLMAAGSTDPALGHRETDRQRAAPVRRATNSLDPLPSVDGCQLRGRIYESPWGVDHLRYSFTKENPSSPTGGGRGRTRCGGSVAAAVRPPVPARGRSPPFPGRGNQLGRDHLAGDRKTPRRG